VTYVVTLRVVSTQPGRTFNPPQSAGIKEFVYRPLCIGYIVYYRVSLHARFGLLAFFSCELLFSFSHNIFGESPRQYRACLFVHPGLDRNLQDHQVIYTGRALQVSVGPIERKVNLKGSGARAHRERVQIAAVCHQIVGFAGDGSGNRVSIQLCLFYLFKALGHMSGQPCCNQFHIGK
jgi:hypothetical protein